MDVFYVEREPLLRLGDDCVPADGGVTTVHAPRWERNC